MSFNPYQVQLDQLSQKISQTETLLHDPDFKTLAEAELIDLRRQQAEMQQAAAEYDQDAAPAAGVAPTFTNCIVEVRSGTGGDEAKIWAGDLLRMYQRFIDKIGLKYEYIDEMIIKIKGKVTDSDIIDQLTEQPAAAEETDIAAQPVTPPPSLTPYDLFKFESGVHRVQRVPATEAQGRVHTSTASIAVLPEIAAQHVTIKDEELEWQFTRSGGAGGQNVNKVNTAVRLTHKPSGIMVSARQERTQAQNREIALELLRAQLWDIEEEKRLQTIGQARSAIGRSMRSEKIRTYNYPQNRVTDHRINQSWYSLDTIMEGDLEKMIASVSAGLRSL